MALNVTELWKLSQKPMWPGAASLPVGKGDRDLEVAEAEGIVERTCDGFILTAHGRAHLARVRNISRR